jgi:hypothetical protein
VFDPKALRFRLERLSNFYLDKRESFRPSPGRISSMRNPSADVVLAEFYLSPTMENWTGSTQPQMGCFPACRWTYFVKRHNRAFLEIMWRRRPRLRVAAASRRQVSKSTGTVL